ncbi:hypothetical protein V8E52_000313, partial [Russula decolorans]
MFPNLPATMNQAQLAQNVQELHQQVAQLQQQVAQLQQQNEQIVQNQSDVNRVESSQALNQVNGVLVSLNEVNERVAQIDGRLQNAEDFLPIKLYNSSASMDCPLQYPPAVAVERPMPNTKSELLDLTVAQCINVAGTLGLAHLGAGATVADRRKQISDYLGCGVV